MKYIYNIIGHIYSFILKVGVFFSPKARMIQRGRWHTWRRLREKLIPGAQYIWVHAASLGEFEQGRTLIEKIRKDHPEYRIVLTFFSPSGYEVRKNYDQADAVVYLPADRIKRVNKFLDMVKPQMAFFIKYDFWPCFLLELEARQIPTYLVSGIFRSSQLFFRWYGGMYRRLLHCFTMLYVQDEASHQLLARYNIHNVLITGDTRFDRVIEISKRSKYLPIVEAFAASASGKVLVAGSSWPADEELFVRYINSHKEVKLIVAPHVADAPHIVRLIAYVKRPFIRLSEATTDNVGKYDCLVVDSYGILSSIYRYGHIAYIGGGFGRGIHNTPEAAVYGLPVIFGPKYHKFIEARGLIEAGGAFSVSTPEEFAALMDRLIHKEGALEEASHSAYEYVHRYAGATDRVLSDVFDVSVQS